MSLPRPINKKNHWAYSSEGADAKVADTTTGTEQISAEAVSASAESSTQAVPEHSDAAAFFKKYHARQGLREEDEIVGTAPDVRWAKKVSANAPFWNDNSKRKPVTAQLSASNPERLCGFDSKG